MPNPSTLVEPAPSGTSPPSARSNDARGYAHFYGGVLWPAWDRLIRGRTTARSLAFVEAMQWRSPETIEGYQVHALRSLLAHAGRHVPYWRDTFRRLGFDARDVRTRDDLVGLPVLTRETVRERYRDLVDPAYAPYNLKKGTSGSDGDATEIRVLA